MVQYCTLRKGNTESQLLPYYPILYENTFFSSSKIHKIIYCPYEDLTWIKRSNIARCRRELPWALPLATPSGEGLYLTVYPLSCPNLDTVHAF